MTDGSDSYWKGRKVLVSGGGGFIGSHLAERLVASGARVRAFVRYNSRNDWGMLEMSSRDKLKEMDVVMGDLRDPDAVRQAVKGTETVFHLASLIAIPYSYVHPREVVETNVLGALNVLSAAREAGVEKVVHTSTSEVYGTARYVPIDEEHPLQGQSPYSASKIGADKLAESFHLSFGLPVATIRPFNTYGPRQSARAVIPTIITQALAGGRVTLGSFHPTRDFTFVQDTVSAFILVAESPRSVGEVINIGSCFEISIGDLAHKLRSLLGRDFEITSETSRVRPENSEVERLWCNNEKAKKILGWTPQVTLDEGLSRTIEWMSTNQDLYKPDMYNI